MSRDDWYRNTEWNIQVSTEFEVKLARARRKEQYLRIQACTLAPTHPNVALSLLERYFALPVQFDAAQAHVDRATAFLAQAKVEDALSAYESALAREAEFPNMKTYAYLNLPFEIAIRTLKERFPQAIKLLEEHKDRLMFAVDFFKWNSAHAIIAYELGQSIESRDYAKAALEAAERDHSGFRYHPDVGLVNNSLSEIHNHMRRLSEA
jgi:tetratricopeptide (TPR) repeat protein